MKYFFSILTLVAFIASAPARADILIEYSEVGSDLLLEFSGSLNYTGSTGNGFNTLEGIGNQGTKQNSIFYNAPTPYAYLTRFNNVTASADTFWSVGTDYTGNTGFGDIFMFRYNTSDNSVQVWISENTQYNAGDLLVGSLTAGGYSIASSGITDWNVDLGGGVGTITIQASSVPSPATIAVFLLGALALRLSRSAR